ncbi:GAF domain-containing protein [Modestobacter sp. SSW1-42]|uniref:GAF domain-containing protein n=1 Tax=Modestobacter sp. SSW1-42 TaxID=596372 RepID=UPI00398698DD
MAAPDDLKPAGATHPAGGPALSFPDLPRLELDQLLGQLVDRAQEVMATQGRLRGLLRANQLVTSELESAAVLHRTAEAARQLVGARRAVLDVTGPAGTVVESVAAGSGPAPRGSRQEARAGAVLDVPIRVRGEVVGALHLQDDERDVFSREDRELVQALAATAGLSVSNSWSYESARRRGEWLQASAAITRELLAAGDSGAGALELVARGIRDVAEADVVAVLLPDPQSSSGALRVEVLVGPREIEGTGEPVPVSGTVLGRVLREGRPVRLVDGTGEGAGALPWTGVDVAAVLAVPLRGSEVVLGVLCAARVPGRPGFSPTDAEMAGDFAAQAAVAIELSAARAEQQRAVVLDERERIAMDLHDTVVQQMFSVGLTLQGAVAGLPDDRPARRVRDAVEEIDRIINRIRSTVFPLRAEAGGPSPREQVMDAVAEASGALGFEPDVRVSGLLDGAVTEDLVHDVAGVVREALLDVARRRRATTASIDVVGDREGVVVHVRDDDRQPPDQHRTAEAALRRRAERHGGTCTVTAGTPAGTSQYWWVPCA